MGHGPFNALHLCLLKCLTKRYPEIAGVHLKDYKVRVINSQKETAAKVRVLVEWSYHQRTWSTVGVSDNVIEASWKALVGAIRLELMRLTEKDGGSGAAVEGLALGGCEAHAGLRQQSKTRANRSISGGSSTSEPDMGQLAVMQATVELPGRSFGKSRCLMDEKEQPGDLSGGSSRTM